MVSSSLKRAASPFWGKGRKAATYESPGVTGLPGAPRPSPAPPAQVTSKGGESPLPPRAEATRSPSRREVQPPANRREGRACVQPRPLGGELGPALAASAPLPEPTFAPSRPGQCGAFRRAMDTSDLFTSCKKGDVCRVRYLLEQRDVEINVRDKWDSTPLYYACLCGHEELVQYLLANGAKCEANTFDGERCLYGALNDTIRRVLKEYKQITAKCMKRDYYDAFLQRLLEQGYHSDIVFIVHGKSFCAHRCVLGARSAYFAEMFETKWKGKNVIALKHPLINPAAFSSLLQYLYTGCLDIDVEYVNDCKRLAKQCQLQDLIEDLETKCKKVYEFVSSKPGTCVKVLTIEPSGNSQLQEDLALLAECALPAEFRVGFGELPFDSTDSFSSYPDLCFRVSNYSFFCHKAFFCGRSDYFKALLEDHFSESEELQTQPSIPVVTLHDISEEIFIRVLYYIYSDDTELSPENAYEVLCVADMYLLPGLKRLCGRTLAQVLDEDSVVSIWKIAKLFQLTRLEDQCTEYMARIIEKLVEFEEFAAAVKENADAVEERQETDSIPLVDDIRFHITSNVQTYSAIEEANQKLDALDNLLASIGLEC
ncbi:ankyrin repeat and BTB/POZ domain-containing protein 1 [Crotalus adamanteus]|uniref:Ankyrin repeat and BTB/POZ domain-containing protein 1 n=3 Tax=Crotalus TaxID=8728 RepID=A0AAW1BVJ1_CROAD